MKDEYAVLMRGDAGFDSWLSELSKCEACAGEGGYHTGDLFGVGYRLSGHIGTQYHECDAPYCQGGMLEVIQCYDCASEMMDSEVPAITVAISTFGKRWAYALCSGCVFEEFSSVNGHIGTLEAWA